MNVALILFALAAVGGLIMASQRLGGRPQPALPLALIHGAAAAAGLVSLILAVAGAGGVGSYASTGLVLLVIAALGGFVLFSFHLRGKPLPIPVMIIHALVAVAGFLILLFGALG